MKNRIVIPASIAALLLAAPSLAQAHHAEFMRDKPLLQGLSMPIHGLDHMFVTIAVGLIAAQLTGRARWIVPGVFTLAILLGGMLNIFGIPVPLAEHAILASIAIFGALLAWKSRVPVLLTVGMVGLFAIFHGTALIANDGYIFNFPVFIAGCLVSALALQAAGFGAGLLMKHATQAPIHRYAGFALIALAVIVGLFPAANNVVINLIETR